MTFVVTHLMLNSPEETVELLQEAPQGAVVFRLPKGVPGGILQAAAEAHMVIQPEEVMVVVNNSMLLSVPKPSALPFLQRWRKLLVAGG